MALLTLPKWIKAGQVVQSIKAPEAFMPEVETWTIADLRSMNNCHDSYIRMECKTKEGYQSVWITLDEFLRHWRRAPTVSEA